MKPQSFSLMFPTFEKTGSTFGLASGIGCPLPRSDWPCSLLGVAILTLGRFFSHGCGSPLHMAGQFCHAYVGITAIPNSRQLEKQLLGRYADLRGGLA